MSAAASLFSRAAPLLILAALWEFVARAGIVSPGALPALSSVLAVFAGEFSRELFYHTWLSLVRGAIAMAFAIPFGIAAGILIAWYLPVRVVLNPLLQCLYPMPKVALIPLTIIWLGIGNLSKISLIFVGALVPIVMSAYQGARSIEQTLLWTARSLGARESEVLREVLLPAALPEILNGVRTALALAFILIVAGEFVIANNGVGNLINLWGQAGQYPAMFAGVLLISAAGFAVDRAFVALSSRMLAGRQS
ncbi:MAG: ABC transporter permease [Alphaproteobacteria bacterium]|nr:ABC transporter permease [Alphaproteobacteria bacterium]